jgi:hypothetical protein
MESPSLEIGSLRMSYSGGEMPASRAETISRLTLARVEQLAERQLGPFEGDLTIEQLAPPPIQVSLNAMSDEAIAMAGAQAIIRALLAAAWRT